MENNKYTLEFTVVGHDTDLNKRMKPHSFMNYAQEMAYESASRLGFGYDELIKNNTAWILSRYHFKFLRPVLWREKVTMETWHKGFQGLFFIRDFKLCGEDGQPSILGTSSWVVLDMAARSLVRSDQINAIIPADSVCTEDVIEQNCPKVIMPRTAEPELVNSHAIKYTDLDFLGHTNNVQYVIWSMDAVGTDITFNKRCTELFINFSKEIPAGKTVDIYRLIQENEDGTKTVTVEGKVEGVQSFCCKMIFEA